MRIAQVAPLHESVPPKLYGGTERVVSWLTEELVREGHAVTLFASGDSTTRARLVPITPRSLRLDKRVRKEMPHLMVELERVIQMASEFDLIHWHVDYWSFPLIRRLTTPSVVTLHGRLDLQDLSPLYREYRDMPVVSISNAQREPIPWANWQGTVYHGMPRDLFAFRAQPGSYLAFLGRISPEKGLPQAIEIARRTGMPLKIAAKIDKEDKEYYEEQIKPLLNSPLVNFVGEISQREKNEFLGNAYAVLFPIQWREPFGLVMIESMACGTPVIAFPGGSVGEIMEDGKTGFVVKGVDEAVSGFARISEVNRRGCRRVFEKRFTATRMAHDYLAIYDKVIENKQAALELAKTLA
ncbi:MAG: glycosyltransferase family 4 protein [Chloroflexi bacterium]|nr:glycosyltransferase family 4 protein [Chloroflexota bacterium]